MGRQYLQLAQRLGNLEPQYQIWAAWSVVQAGYPEDAEPIVARCSRRSSRAACPARLEGTLHLLSGEIHQARRSPADLRRRSRSTSRAFANGQDATPAVELRLAQIEISSAGPPAPSSGSTGCVAQGKGGAAAEQLAVLTLQEMSGTTRPASGSPRRRVEVSPEPELASSRRPCWSGTKQARGGRQSPRRVPRRGARQRHGRPIAGPDPGRGPRRPCRARELLRGVAERGDNSAPLVQLALLELAAKPTRRGRGHRRQGPGPLEGGRDRRPARRPARPGQGKTDGGLGHFNAALKKDPEQQDRPVLEGPARRPHRPVAEAAKALESIVRDEPVKEVDTGLSLLTAAQSALAGIALETRRLRRRPSADIEDAEADAAGRRALAATAGSSITA